MGGDSFPTRQEIEACMLADRHGFLQRLRGLRKRGGQGEPVDQGLERL